MEILERYLYAVGRWLPRKQKKDIQAELESSIYDTLEAIYGKKDEYTEEEVSEVIKEFGSPWKVAAGYNGLSDKLIGPELLPFYYWLTAIISGAVALGLFVSYIVGLFRPDMNFGIFALEFLKLVSSLVVAVATVIGFSTIVFALIEKNVPGYRVKPLIVGRSDEKKTNANIRAWSPRDLPPVPKEKQRIPRWEPIVGICFAIVAIVFFNFFRDKLGIYYTPSWDSEWLFIPFLSEDAMKAFLPFWNLAWGVSIVFGILQLTKGRWTLSLRLLDIAKSFLDVTILAIMIKGPELIDMKLLLSYSDSKTAEALTPVAEMFNFSIDLVLTIILILTALGILGKAAKLFKSGTYMAIIKKT